MKPRMKIKLYWILVFLTGFLITGTIDQCHAQPNKLKYIKQEQGDKRFGIIISTGYDPFNAHRGGKRLENGMRRNQKAYNGIVRVGLYDGKWEVGITGQFFTAIDYISVGGDVGMNFPIYTDFKGFNVVSIIPAVHWDVVSRKGLDVPDNYQEGLEHWNPGFSLRMRLENIMNSNVYLEAMGKLSMSFDSKYFWGEPITLGNMWERRVLFVSVGYEFL
jgi:hypothetical protein